MKKKIRKKNIFTLKNTSFCQKLNINNKNNSFFLKIFSFILII
jgi:hypothetical protein